MLDYSVVMEWDNPRTSDAGRALEAVRRVAEQMRAQPLVGELLLVFASDSFDGEALRVDLAKPTQGVELRLLPTPDLRYYELKNEGVRQARGRVVVFLDSDLLPEEGCLAALLEPFSDPDVDCVAGHTFLEHGNLYEQTFALAWTFPRRSRAGGLRPSSHFFANSVAARRDVWLRFPFASETVRYRGMCVDVARRMTAEGVTIWIQPAARGSHPPPRGGGEFVRRALAEGRDRFLTLRRQHGTLRSLLGLLRWTGKKALGGNHRIARDCAEVGMKRGAIPAAWAINTGYFVLGFLGGCAQLLRPDRVRTSLEEFRRHRAGARAALPPDSQRPADAGL